MYDEWLASSTLISPRTGYWEWVEDGDCMYWWLLWIDESITEITLHNFS
jgi:hypothetical protein